MYANSHMAVDNEQNTLVKSPLNQETSNSEGESEAYVYEQLFPIPMRLTFITGLFAFYKSAN